MKSKLYYYEAVVLKTVNSPEELKEFLDKLESTSFSNILGFGIEKKSKPKKSMIVKLQLYSLQDDLSLEDSNFLRHEVCLINYRTRSITGNDLAIFRNFRDIAQINKLSIDDFCSNITKEEPSDDTQSD